MKANSITLVVVLGLLAPLVAPVLLTAHVSKAMSSTIITSPLMLAPLVDRRVTSALCSMVRSLARRTC